MMMKQERFTDLDRIPHLNLTDRLRPPMAQLSADFDAVRSKFRPYSFDETVILESEANAPSTLSSTYQVIDVLGWSEQSIELESRLSATTSWIKSFTEGPVKARITREEAGSGGAWHKHYSEEPGAASSRNVFLHVPLMTDENVIFGIRNQPGLTPDTFWQHYAAGEAWIFNSGGFHTVQNKGKVDRCHLYIVISADDPVFKDVLADAQRSYYGPVIGG
jgi:hypothetical protein